MKNKVVTVLVVIVLVLVLLIGGALGFLWYRDNHIFVEGEAYPISARTLDLREEDISFAHYEQVHAQLPDCRILWNVPFQGSKFSSDSETLTVSSLTQEDVAKRVGKSRPAVTNALRLLGLHPEVLDKVRTGTLSAGHARAVLTVKNEKKQLAAAQKIIALGLSVRQAEMLSSCDLVPRPLAPK